MGQMGAKNLIPYPYYHTSKTTAGITITDNGDGTLTFNGTSTSATVIFRLTSNDANIEIPLNKSKYILTWVDSAEHKRYFRIDVSLVKTDETTITVNGESGVINIDNTNGEYKGIYAMAVYTANNQTVSNLTFKPMLRLASDTDNTYQPYAMTNKQLTETIGDLSQTGLTGDSVAAQLVAAVAQIAGKVKLLPEQKTSYTCTSTNFEYTGASVTCPYGHTYIVRARVKYNNSQPTGIIVSQSNTNFRDPYLRYVDEEGGACIVTFMLLTGETAYIYGRWALAPRANDVILNIIDITN
jgi:hypothetical protein